MRAAPRRDAPSEGLPRTGGTRVETSFWNSGVFVANAFLENLITGDGEKVDVVGNLS
jgi:hypothetical protein